MDTVAPSNLPDDFRPLNFPVGRFLAENGPILGRRDGKDIQLGLQVGPQHGNAGGICHGGMSMALADTQLVLGAMAQLDNWSPLMTINTCVDFVRPGLIGSCFRGETKVIRATRNLVFAEAMLYLDGELAMRCSGVLKRTSFEPYEPDHLFLDAPEAHPGERGDPAAPEGFRPVHIPGPFLVVNGPLHGQLDGDILRLGLRIEDRHCNSAGVCHAGTLMTFADVQMGIGMMFRTDEYGFKPTMHMSTDFAVPVKPGAWLVGETSVMRMTRNVAFSSCLLTVDGEVVVRSAGVNKRIADAPAVLSAETLFILPEPA